MERFRNIHATLHQPQGLRMEENDPPTQEEKPANLKKLEKKVSSLVSNRKKKPCMVESNRVIWHELSHCLPTIGGTGEKRKKKKKETPFGSREEN